jgi:hypothetical protein
VNSEYMGWLRLPKESKLKPGVFSHVYSVVVDISFSQGEIKLFHKKEECYVTVGTFSRRGLRLR